MEPQIQHDTDVTENNAPTGGSPATAAADSDSDSPPQILTASCLASLKRLVSQEKITGFHFSQPHQYKVFHM